MHHAPEVAYSYMCGILLVNSDILVCLNIEKLLTLWITNRSGYICALYQFYTISTCMLYIKSLFHNITST